MNLGKTLAVISASVASLFAVSANAGKLDQYATFASEPTVEIDHSAWDTFLGTYVSRAEAGRTILKYGDVTDTDRKSLNSYIDKLEATDPTTLSKEQAYAYWVNLYNAVTVNVILDKYPVKSIRNIGFMGPWGRKLINVDGEKLSLNNVEHDILRVQWRDPRTHYAVNCASFGCPNLQPKAFTAANTEELLDIGAREFINHPRGFSVDDDGNITASSIFKWYRVDFGDNEADVLTHARKYANDELRAKLNGKTDIKSYDYNWSLNEK